MDISDIGESRLAGALSATEAEWGDWRWQVRNRIRSLDQLAAALEPARFFSCSDEDLTRTYPVGVTPYYLSLADPRDPRDPILRQIVPDPAEAGSGGQESADPFAEQERSPVPGVIHRYPDRALVVPTNFCATLCRHCFRKGSWAGGFRMLGDAELDRAVDYVRQDEGIHDVLITGGDPLHLPARRLLRLLRAIRSIDHVEVVRVASRTPVTLPQRIDAEMVGILAAVRPLWFITHFNLAREVSGAARAALRALLDAGITVQNQAVLLRGINDTSEEQIGLSRALLGVGVRPYYLHLGDPVAGAGHFRTSIERGREVVRGMFGRVSGLGIPRLVLDLPGGKGKVPLEASFETRRQGAEVWFESPIDGTEVQFVDPPRSDGERLA